MKEPSNNTIPEPIKKVDLNDVSLQKLSRWTDEKGRLLVLLGFYHGKDPGKPNSGNFERIGADILIVHEETVEYIDMGRLIHNIINKKIKPWKEQSSAPRAINVF